MRTKLVSILTASLAAAPVLLAQVRTTERAPGAAGAPIDASKMKSDEIKNLIGTRPDGTLVKFGNQTLTIGQMKAQEAKIRTRKGAAAGKAPTRVRVKNQQGIQAANQKVLGTIANLANDANVASHAKLRDEAWDLNQKLKTASPNEKTQIQQRLGQIGGQLR